MGETNVEQPPLPSHCHPNENNYTPEAPHLVLIIHLGAWFQRDAATMADKIEISPQLEERLKLEESEGDFFFFLGIEEAGEEKR